jgi:hypothetical protein
VIPDTTTTTTPIPMNTAQDTSHALSVFPQHTIIAMGQAQDLDYWTQQLPLRANLLFGAYDVDPPNCMDSRVECLFIPGTTWSQGRNHLVQHFKNTKSQETKYMTITDADVRLECSHSNCLQHWIEFLDITEPPAAFIIGNDYYLKEKTPPNTMMVSDAFDVALNAFHVDAIDTILPYTSKFDEISWWISQSVLWQSIHCFAPTFAVRPVDVFYNNQGHQPYPRGRDREKEIQAQIEVTRSKNVTMPLPSEDYKVNWNMEHIIPLGKTNWTNKCM